MNNNNYKTQIQRDIELAVTNGRGYETISEALDIVNQRDSRTTQEKIHNTISSPESYWAGNPELVFNLEVTIGDVIECGMIPLYFDGPREEPTFSFKNPCREISLGEPLENILPVPIRKPTILEEIQNLQFVKHHKNCVRERLFA